MKNKNNEPHRKRSQNQPRQREEAMQSPCGKEPGVSGKLERKPGQLESSEGDGECHKKELEKQAGAIEAAGFHSRAKSHWVALCRRVR